MIIESTPSVICSVAGSGGKVEASETLPYFEDEEESTSYYYTTMPVTPSHQQTARTRLSSSIRISTHQIIASLMTRDPQSIRQLHDLLSKLTKQHELEIAGLTTSRRSSSNAGDHSPRPNTPSVLITEQQILAILDVSVYSFVQLLHF